MGGERGRVLGKRARGVYLQRLLGLVPVVPGSSGRNLEILFIE